MLPSVRLPLKENVSDYGSTFWVGIVIEPLGQGDFYSRDVSFTIEKIMSYTVTAVVHENQQAQTIIESLGRSGIDRERVQITTDDAVVKLQSDRVGAWSIGGFVVGVLIGGVTGWILMPSGVLGVVGALWCAVIGAIIGGRALGYAAFDRVKPKQTSVPKVVVTVQAEQRSEVEQISAALTSGGAQRIAWSESQTGQ